MLMGLFQELIISVTMSLETFGDHLDQPFVLFHSLDLIFNQLIVFGLTVRTWFIHNFINMILVLIDQMLFHRFFYNILGNHSVISYQIELNSIIHLFSI